jgi:hypothetical protein
MEILMGGNKEKTKPIKPNHPLSEPQQYWWCLRSKENERLYLFGCFGILE